MLLSEKKFKEKSYLGYNIQLIELLLSWVLLNSIHYGLFYAEISEDLLYFNSRKCDIFQPVLSQ